MMEHWGIKSYENDGAADAIDAAMERIHGDTYDSLMDDRNKLTFDEVQEQLACPETLAASIEALREEPGGNEPFEAWDEAQRLAFAGIVVRHAEFGVIIPAEVLARAIGWLETEPLDWGPETTVRRLRRQKELALLRNQQGPG